MSRRPPRPFLVASALVASLLPAAQSSGAQESPTSDAAKPVVRWSVQNDTTPPLRDLPVVAPGAGIKEDEEREIEPAPLIDADAAPGVDTALDTQAAVAEMPSPIRNFEGNDNTDGSMPPDTVGDVGPNHYVQMVNIHFAIWNKRTGQLVYGPVANNTLWQGFGGACEQHNHGDPIVLYDQLAGRWLLSQFALDDEEENGGPYYECIAISKTDDPTGEYHRYAFFYDKDVFNDYPHLGVWPDAYYMSVNQFHDDEASHHGAGAVAFERERMLQGLPARMVKFDVWASDPAHRQFRGQLAADLDGPPPPPGTPGFFAEVDDSSRIGPTDALRIWEFRVDWSNPAASTFGLNGAPNQVIAVKPFTMMLCKTPPVTHRLCVTNPGPPLDSLGDRLMYRLAYRNFGSHQALVANHTVDADGTQHAGIRWYELRKPTGGAWKVQQQSTYAPDSENRWMGALAMDREQGIALGYSVAGPTTFPGVRYAGRRAGDPPNSLPRTEKSLIEGGATQVHVLYDPTQPRWGDYSSMNVDNDDDCTFWYTQEYIPIPAPTPSGVVEVLLADWHTRIGSFRFPECTRAVYGTLEGAVLDQATGRGVPGAYVQAGAYSTVADRDGRYRLPPMPPGTYSVTASAAGYAPRTVGGIVVSANKTTTREIRLTPVSISTVSGRVLDGGGQGWPLYARIDIEGYGGSPIFTDPVTGAFSVPLPAGNHRFTVTAIDEGYEPRTQTVSVPTGGPVEFALPLKTTVCPAGYAKVGAGFAEPFESRSTPAGWTVTDNAGFGSTWRFDDPGNRTNLTGGEGGFAIVDSDQAGQLAVQDTELISPLVDFTGIEEVVLEFDTDFDWFEGGLPEEANVDVSSDGGETWTNVWKRSLGDYRGPQHESVDVSEHLADEAEARVRFHYGPGNFEFWWQVDNAELGEVTCEPRDGGLVVGHVLRSSDRSGINGATVKSEKVPADSATTFATPDDRRQPDGMYILFSSATGGVKFTASAAGFVPKTSNATVVDGAIVPLTFQLATG